MIAGVDVSNGLSTEGKSTHSIFRFTPTHYLRPKADDMANMGFISN
jgi:hypothetical protein